MHPVRLRFRAWPAAFALLLLAALLLFAAPPARADGGPIGGCEQGSGCEAEYIQPICTGECPESGESGGGA